LFNSKDLDYSFNPIAFINTETMLVISDKDTDKQALYQFDIPSKTLTNVLFEHETYDLVDADISKESNTPSSVSFYQHGRLTEHFFAASQQKEAKIISASFPSKQFYITQHHRGTQQKILKTFAADDPGTYYLYDYVSKKATLISKVYPGLSEYAMAKDTTFTVESQGKIKIEAILTQPIENSNQGLLIMPHGGPVGIRDNSNFNFKVQYFASRGFSVLRVNFRGSSGYGKDFAQQGVAQFGQAIEQDISAAFKQVQAKHKFKRICTIGSSYGGYSAYMLAIHKPSDIDCVVATYGVYDIPLLFNESNAKTSQRYRDFVAKTVGNVDSSHQQLSPVYLAKQLQAPSLIIAGKEDLIAGFEHSHRMLFTLNKLGKDVESVFYQDTGHGHDTFWGEWHEHALTYDYLRRKLQLPQLDISANSKEDKALLAKELDRIGDSFYHSIRIQQDNEKALYFYRQAAELESSDAMHNIASFYLLGEYLNKDISKALIWYKRSAQAGGYKAAIYLSHLYFEGKHVEKNYQTSWQYLQQAQNIKPNSEVDLFIARAYCLGAGVEQNLQLCKQLLEQDSSKESEQLQQQKNKIFGDIFTHELSSKEARKMIRPVVKRQYDFSLFPIEIEENHYGKYTRTDFDKYEYSEMDTYSIGNDTKIGVHFDVEPESLFEPRGKSTAIAFRWIRLTSRSAVEYGGILFGTRYDWEIYRTLSEKDKTTSAYRLELYDLYGKQLYSRTFNLSTRQTPDSAQAE